MGTRAAITLGLCSCPDLPAVQSPADDTRCRRVDRQRRAAIRVRAEALNRSVEDGAVSHQARGHECQACRSFVQRTELGHGPGDTATTMKSPTLNGPAARRIDTASPRSAPAIRWTCDTDRNTGAEQDAHEAGRWSCRRPSSAKIRTSFRTTLSAEIHVAHSGTRRSCQAAQRTWSADAIRITEAPDEPKER